MCTVAAAVVMTAVSTVASMAATAAQIANQNSAARAQGRNAKEAALADYNAMEIQRAQVNAQANAEAVEIKRQAMIERGRIESAIADGGFMGNSPLRELYNQRAKEKEALGNVRENLANALLQNQVEARKIEVSAKSRYNEARSRTINGLQAGLQIGSEGLRGFSSGYTAGTAMTKGFKT